jgi:hypothetical protein
MLDGKGRLVRRGKVAGRPVVIRRVAGGEGAALVVVGTTKGAVSIFAPAP